MNIWIINHYFNLPQNPGGTRHYNLAKYLIAQGHHVTIFSSNFNHQTLLYQVKDQKKIIIENIEGINIVWIPSCSYSSNGLKRILNMVQFASRLYGFRKKSYSVSDPDLIIGSTPHLFAPLSGLFLSKFFKIPFVLEVRDLWPESLVEIAKTPKWHPITLLFRMIANLLYKKSDRIITLLPNSIKHLSTYRNNINQIRYLPNFVSIKELDEHDSSSKNNKCTFMYAGTLGKANHLIEIMKACLILKSTDFEKDAEIVLIGSGPEKSTLEKFIIENSLNFITIKDSVSKNQIHHELKVADVFFIILSDTQLYQFGISPNKLFDYMACCKPILFIGNCSNNPVAELSSGIHIEDLSPNKIAEAFMQLLNLDDSKKREMGKKNYDFVSERHNIDIIGSQLNDLLITCRNESVAEK